MRIGIISYFNEHFVKTGKVSKELGRFFTKMFDNRQSGDYDDFIIFDENEVFDWLNKANDFISNIEKMFID